MRAFDLFAGAGGWDIGASVVGIDVDGVEIMPEATTTRDAAGLATIHDDVWTVPAGMADGYDGLIASPPCQTFSQAGKGAGRRALDDVLALLPNVPRMTLPELRTAGDVFGDDKTGLVLTPLWYALHHGYQWAAWEQVPSVLPVWEACAIVLAEHGWSTWTGYLNAEQYGVPQTRKRAFLLAHRDGIAAPPTPTHSRYYSRTPTRLDPGMPRWVSMAEGLGWGMTQRPSYTVNAGGSRGSHSGHEWGSGAVRRHLLALAESGDRRQWVEKGWGMTARPYPTVSTGVGQGGSDALAVGGSGARRIIYGEKSAGRWVTHPDYDPRVTTPDGEPRWRDQSGTPVDKDWPDKRPATTVASRGLVQNPGETANRHNTSTKSRNDGIRVSVGEAGILQTFPADFPWQGKKGRCYLQVGNAVPPLLAAHVLEAITAAPAPAPVVEPHGYAPDDVPLFDLAEGETA